MASYVVKAHFEDTLRRFSLSGVSFERLERQVRDLFKIPPGARLVLTYVDSDGDAVTMAEDADLHDALVLQSLNPLRLKATAVLKKAAEESAVRSEVAAVAAQQQGKQGSSKERGIPSEKAGGEEGRNISAAADLSAKTDIRALNNTTKASANEGVKGPPNARDRSENDGCKTPDATNPEESKQPVHFGVVCDDCGARDVKGTRYKSLNRYDYDLCETCFQKPGVDGNDYIAVKKARPDGRSIHFRRPTGGCDSRNSNYGIHRRGFENNAVNRRGRPRGGGRGPFGNPRCGVDGSTSVPAGAHAEVCHPGVTCDKCRVSPIVGPRFKSTKRFNYDLCQTCVQKVEGHALDEYMRIDRPRHEAHPYMLRKSNHAVSPAYATCPFVRYGRPMSPRRVFLVAMVPQTAETHGEHQNPTTEPAAGEGSTEANQASTKTAENSPEEGKFAAGVEQKVKTREVGQHNDDAKEEKTTSVPLISGSETSGNAHEVKPHVEQKDVTPKDDTTPTSQNAVTESATGAESHDDSLDVKPAVSGLVIEKQVTDKVLDEKKVFDEDTFADGWDPILEELQEMGFYDSNLNRRLLSQNNGSMKRTVKELVGIEKIGQSKASKGEKEE